MNKKNKQPKLSTKPYKGTRDFYPEDFRKIQYIRDVWTRVCQSFGYEQYDTPILEPLELYSSKTSEEIVMEQSFMLTDRADRKVMMRPEMTPSVSRLVAGRRQELGYPLRLFSMPNCFRYERPQKGRLREFWQLNVDIFGVEESAGYRADAELVLISDAIMKELGATSEMYEIKVSDRGFLDWLLKSRFSLDSEKAKLATRLIDKKAKISSEDFEVELCKLGVDKNDFDFALKCLNCQGLDNLPEEAKQEQFYKKLKQIADVLESSGVEFTFDGSIARGFDYYTGFVFEVVDKDPDNNRSMFGGGRYDGLLANFGVEPIPTTGFGMGDTVVAEMLTARGLWPESVLNKPSTDVILIAIGDAGLEAVDDVAVALRAEGKNVAIDYNINRKLDKRKSAASKLQIPKVELIGAGEL